MKGVDWGYSKIKGKTIKDAGYSFVCRYLSHSPGKNITKEELDDFKSNGLKVVLVWETTEDRISSGFEGGKKDAQDSLQLLKTLELPLEQVIYFAVDEDVGNSQYLNLNNYFKGIRTILLTSRIGVYGSLMAVNYCFENGLAFYGWQTYAWSHGKWDVRAQLRQVKNGYPRLDGVVCDSDESITDDFGQLKY